MRPTRARRLGTVGVVLATCICPLAGCDACRTVPEVAVVLPSADNPFWRDIALGARAAADPAGDTRIRIISGQANTDARSQRKTLRRLLGGRGSSPFALVLAPASATAIVPVIAQYNRSGIPVIVVDSRLDTAALARANAHVDYFVGSQNRDGARQAAERLAASLGDGPVSVLFLAGSPTHETGMARAAGFRDGARPNWKVDERVANWNRADANRAVRAAVQRGVPDGIFAANDEMALGAIAALKSVGVPRARWPVIVGFDATPDARKAIEEGTMCASVAQQPGSMGQRAVEIALRYLQGSGPASGTEEALAVTVVDDSTRHPCRRAGGSRAAVP